MSLQQSQAKYRIFSSQTAYMHAFMSKDLFYVSVNSYITPTKTNDIQQKFVCQKAIQQVYHPPVPHIYIGKVGS